MWRKHWAACLRIFAPFIFVASLCVLLFATVISLFLEQQLFRLQYEKELESLQKDTAACQSAYEQTNGEPALPEQLLPTYLKQQDIAAAGTFLTSREGLVLTENSYYPVGRDISDLNGFRRFVTGGVDLFDVSDGSFPLLLCIADIYNTPYVLVRMQPTSQINTGYQTVQRTLVSTALIVFAISFLVSLFFAVRPVKYMIAATQKLTLSEWSGRRQATQQFLTELCLHGKSQAEIDAALPTLESGVDIALPTGLFLVQLDHLSRLHSLPPEDQDALLYGVKNLFEELLSPDCRAVGLPGADRRWLLFLYTSIDENAGSSPLVALLLHAQQQAGELLDLSLSLTFSSRKTTPINLHRLYLYLIQAARLRLFDGWGCQIDADSVPRPRQSPSWSQSELYRRIDAENTKLRSGGVEDAAGYCALLRPCIGSWVDYQSVLLAVKNGLEQCALLLQDACYTASDFELTSLQFDDCETVPQIEQRLNEYVAALSRQISGAEQHRYAAYVAQAKQLIDSHFRDSAYGVKQIADEMGLSSAYISKIYREYTQHTLIEALTQQRIQEAARLVRTPVIPLADVYHQSGYSSNNYFYRVFRNIYGMTPLEFRRLAQKQPKLGEEAKSNYEEP